MREGRVRVTSRRFGALGGLDTPGRVGASVLTSAIGVTTARAGTNIRPASARLTYDHLW
jgi:hypothetical protein